MNWPSMKDFNDAIRKPAVAFADPDLAAGDPVVARDARPLAVVGDSQAEVYQLCADDDRAWAVKCFSRPVPELKNRYAQVQELFTRSAFPFAVGFIFLEDGIRVAEQCFPVLKMDWVEGSPLNQVARDRADSPAVMDNLLNRFVRLSRELRGAGIAHADLQHRNIILVPGKWPGAYTLKLIDYDATYLPALADTPSGEFGHPNYQHPLRATEGTYSADLDRFPLLVIATALKALSVLGPELWKKYDSGDNLLFTTADFQYPRYSPLMRELWQTGHPALQTLVAKLALACTQPISQTPWLDDATLDGSEPQLTPEEMQTARALGFGPVTRASSEPDVAEPIEIITFDDEPEVSRQAVKGQRHTAPVASAEVFSLDDQSNEQSEEQPVQQKQVKAQSRPKPKPRPEREPAGRFPLLPAAIGAILLVAVGVIAGILITKRSEPDDTARKQPDDTPGKPDRGDGVPAPALPAIAPPPHEFIPRPAPPVIPVQPGFYRVWDKQQVGNEHSFVKPLFGRDGQLAYISQPGHFEAFDTKTGAWRVEFRGPGLPAAVHNIWTLDRDRLAVVGFPMKGPGLWDAKTGEQLPALLAQDPLPPAPAGVQPFAIECQLSPDGRYVFAGYQGQFQGGTYGQAPYRVVEVATGKVVIQGEWSNGTARFTADGSRMLMTETNGRARWVKTATGEVEIEWSFQQNTFPRMIGGMSADGSLFVYFGKPPGLPFDNYLIDGKTGQVLRKVGTGFSGDRGTMTADGRWLVGVGYELPDIRRVYISVADARTGEVLIRTPIEGDINNIQRAAVTADGKFVMLHQFVKREVALYELRGEVPVLPAVARAPAPLTGIPEKVPPGTPVVVIPPVAPPVVPPVVPPVIPPGVPAADVLKARWTVATETGIMANGLPQMPLYSRDGKTIILSGGNTGTILTFDAKTGAAGPSFDVQKGGPGGVYWLSPFGDDKVVCAGFDAKQATWDTKTGKRVDEIKFPELPPLPAAARGHAGITYAMSPSGRYALAARKEALRPVVAGPLRVLDTTTNKVVVSADSNGVKVAFTADESRMFVLDGLGKAKWYKLPSGEADGEWAAGEGVQAETARFLGMTSDGRTILYHGALANQAYGVYLVDGKTGEMLRRLGGAPYQATWSALSPDGRYVVMSLYDVKGDRIWYADVFEVGTWRLVGRVMPPEKGSKSAAQFGFSPDGKELALFYQAAKELRVVPLPDGGAQVVIPPGPNPPRPVNAPEIRPRWTTASGVGKSTVPVVYDAETRRLVLGNPTAETVAVFDAQTGRVVRDKFEDLRWGQGELYLLPGGKLGFHYRTAQTVSVWDPKEGKAGEPITVPDIPLGPDRKNHRSIWLSADAKFMAVARNATPQAKAPLKVFDLANQNQVVTIAWTGGSVYFTSDASRVLIAESGGRCRWFKLPTGEADDKWELPQADGVQAPQITSVSADGKVLGYNGPGIGAERFTVAVLNGKTGEVVRGFGGDYLGQISVSGDGRLAAVARRPAPGDTGFVIDVVELTEGKVIGRASARGDRNVPTFFLTADGRALVVHDHSTERVYWYDLPEQRK
jgi:WD40 repeat protein